MAPRLGVNLKSMLLLSRVAITLSILYTKGELYIYILSVDGQYSTTKNTPSVSPFPRLVPELHDFAAVFPAPFCSVERATTA